MRALVALLVLAGLFIATLSSGGGGDDRSTIRDLCGDGPPETFTPGGSEAQDFAEAQAEAIDSGRLDPERDC